MENIRDYFDGFDLRPPAPSTALDLFREMYPDVPQDFLSFYEITNGFEGNTEEEYLSIWPIEEIPALNANYEVDVFTPGLLYFGSNGGLSAFAFDLKKAWRIVECDFIGMDYEDVIHRAENFTNFLEPLLKKN